MLKVVVLNIRGSYQYEYVCTYYPPNENMFDININVIN
jgi:hypothetical protein